jgi:hypothetical protein
LHSRCSCHGAGRSIADSPLERWWRGLTFPLSPDDKAIAQHALWVLTTKRFPSHVMGGLVLQEAVDMLSALCDKPSGRGLWVTAESTSQDMLAAGDACLVLLDDACGSRQRMAQVALARYRALQSDQHIRTTKTQPAILARVDDALCESLGVPDALCAQAGRGPPFVDE